MDKTTKFLAYDGKVSIICTDTTELVEKIKNLHDLTPTTTAVMGRFATISGLMGFTEIKEDKNSITIQMRGNGPISSLVSRIKREGNMSKIKAYMQNTMVELPLKENGKIDVGGAVGNTGYLNIINENEITETEYSGLVPIVSGEIAEDFTEYFAKSKQKPTVIALGVLIDKNGVKSSGGYMINLMPDASEEEISKIENAIEKCPNISKMIEDGMSLKDIAIKASGDENVITLEENLKIEYKCDCNREKFEKGLISIGKEELEKIIVEDEKAEIKCNFCNKEYNFSKEELENILEKIL